jgi:hypothetical protein
MLEREVNRKYRVELAASLAVYALFITGSIVFGKRLDEGWVRTLVMLVPAIPLFVMIWVIFRQFARLDEFVRLRSLESLAVAGAVTAALSFTYGFLESAGYPKLSMYWVWVVMGLTWGLHSCTRQFFSK